jgi:hypothetical protein
VTDQVEGFPEVDEDDMHGLLVVDCCAPIVEGVDESVGRAAAGKKAVLIVVRPELLSMLKDELADYSLILPTVH